MFDNRGKSELANRRWDAGKGPKPGTLPRPRFVGLTDRDDGTVWYMIHLQSENRWGVTNVRPLDRFGLDTIVFAPFEGPLLRNPTGVHCLRVLVRAKRLGYELADPLVGENPPLRTRILNFPFFLKLHAKEFVNEGDTLSYLVETLDG